MRDGSRHEVPMFKAGGVLNGDVCRCIAAHAQVPQLHAAQYLE
jgi:hypothetical protein